MPKTSLTIHWIPGHKDFDGNERADIDLLKTRKSIQVKMKSSRAQKFYSPARNYE